MIFLPSLYFPYFFARQGENGRIIEDKYCQQQVQAGDYQTCGTGIERSSFKLQYHVSCFRCAVCFILLTERYGKCVFFPKWKRGSFLFGHYYYSPFHIIFRMGRNLAWTIRISQYVRSTGKNQEKKQLLRRRSKMWRRSPAELPSTSLAKRKKISRTWRLLAAAIKKVFRGKILMKKVERRFLIMWRLEKEKTGETGKRRKVLINRWRLWWCWFDIDGGYGDNDVVDDEEKKMCDPRIKRGEKDAPTTWNIEEHVWTQVTRSNIANERQFLFLLLSPKNTINMTIPIPIPVVTPQKHYQYDNSCSYSCCCPPKALPIWQFLFLFLSPKITTNIIFF